MKTFLKIQAGDPAVERTHRLAFPWHSAAVLLLVSAGSLVAAEGPVKAVQQALKEQQFFYEEPNGKLDPATYAALRRFQIRHGLSATGEIDTATMEALEGGGNAAPDAASPAATVGGLPPATVERDHEFLAQVEDAAGKPAVEGSPSTLDRPPEPDRTRQVEAPPQPGKTESLAQQAPPPTRAEPVRRESVAQSDTTFQPEPKSPVIVHKAVPIEKPAREVEIQRNWIPERNRPGVALNPPERTFTRTVRPPIADDVEEETNSIPTPPPGAVTITRTVGPDGRLYIYERRTAEPPLILPPDAPRERVRWHHHDGFFHRLFHGDE